MKHDINNYKNAGARFGVFCIAFGSSYFLSTYLAFFGHRFLGSTITNYLYFWPQISILPYGVTIERVASKYYFSNGELIVWTILFWIIIGGLFSWLLRNNKIRTVLILVYPTMIITSILALLLLRIFGYSPYLDGP